MRWMFALWAVLFALGAHAAPTDAQDGLSRTANEPGLLERIGEVGSRVQDTATGLVTSALGFLGVPYRRGGTSAETGFDCSGFVRNVYQQTAGLLLPRSAAQQAAATQRIDKSDLQPGDLVFFNTMRRAFSHVGIYVGNGKFIHAPKPGAEVRVEDLGVSYWARRFDGARRVPEGDANAQAATAITNQPSILITPTATGGLPTSVSGGISGSISGSKSGGMPGSVSGSQP